MEKSVINWSTEDVILHLPLSIKNSENVIRLCKDENLDGKCLLSITDRDFHEPPFINGYNFTLGDRKKFMLWIKELQKANKTAMFDLGLCDPAASMTFVGTNWSNLGYSVQSNPNQRKNKNRAEVNYPPEENRASTLRPEIGKTFIALLYVFLVTWVTAVVMVIVHDKVPDMKKYPPLPDLFLDNVPHIPWAFDMCEITGSFLMAIWIFVLVVHKHRFIILRRFFALAGTVFLLRCITMLITSLSVPGSHLNCAPRSYPPTDEFTNWERRFYQAYLIWSGAGMSVRGVRTCGDYMFSGHTVTLTLLNFFITEYTSRNLYLLHILTWVMNMFGIFFILAAHEHYSIDVFIAFYITSRLFLYYHTLANNQALMQGDSTRTRIWFPLLSFFESAVDGIVPNEYEGPVEVLYNLKQWSVDALKNMTQSEVAKMAGSKISEGAAMGEYSVVRIVDGIKRNWSINDEPGQRLVKIDKIVQVYPVNQQSIEDEATPESIHDNTCIENHFKKKKQ